MSGIRKVLSQGLALLASSLFGALSAFLLQVLLARKLNLESYGNFSALYSAMMICAPLAGAGIGSYLVRGFSRDGLGAKVYFRIAIKLFFASALLVSAAYAAFIYFWKGDIVAAVCLSSVLWIFAFTELFSAKCQLEGRYLELAVFNFLPHGLRLLFIFAALSFSEAVGLVGVVYALLAFSVVLAAIFLSRLFRFVVLVEIKLFFRIPKGERDSSVGPGKLVLNSLPFCLSAFLYLAYFQSPVVYSSYYLGNEAAAVISVCLTLIGAFYILPSIYYQKFMVPRISYWFYHDSRLFVRSYWWGACGALILGGFSASLLYYCADGILLYLFGPRFEVVSELLSVLALAIPLRFLGANFGAYLIDERSQYFKVLALAAVAILSFIVFVVAHESLGLYTGIMALMASEFILLVLFGAFNFMVFKNL